MREERPEWVVRTALGREVVVSMGSGRPVLGMKKTFGLVQELLGTMVTRTDPVWPALVGPLHSLVGLCVLRYNALAAGKVSSFWRVRAVVETGRVGRARLRALGSWRPSEPRAITRVSHRRSGLGRGELNLDCVLHRRLIQKTGCWEIRLGVASSPSSLNLGHEGFERVVLVPVHHQEVKLVFGR